MEIYSNLKLYIVINEHFPQCVSLVSLFFQLEKKQSELQQLEEEKQRREENLQTVKNKLQNKNQEVYFLLSIFLNYINPLNICLLVLHV